MTRAFDDLMTAYGHPLLKRYLGEAITYCSHSAAPVTVKEARVREIGRDESADIPLVHGQFRRRRGKHPIVVEVAKADLPSIVPDDEQLDHVLWQARRYNVVRVIGDRHSWKLECE